MIATPIDWLTDTFRLRDETIFFFFFNATKLPTTKIKTLKSAFISKKKIKNYLLVGWCLLGDDYATESTENVNES